MQRVFEIPPISPESREIVTMVGWIVLIHFVAEAFIMGTLSGWQLDRQVIAVGLLDCTMLTVLTTPPIYSWVVKPFIDSARDAKAELSRELSIRTDQAARLETALASLESSLEQNEKLRSRLQRSNERIAEINELTLQRIGADLHDGPAQLLAYSLLRLGRFFPMIEIAGGQKEADEFEYMRVAMGDTLNELRNISRGLSLPQLSTATLQEAVNLAVTLHQELTGTKVDMTADGLPTDVPQALKVCVYRVVQESLSNAYKHGRGMQQKVASYMDKQMVLEVSDKGPGFDAENTNKDGLGLTGMRARVEALGGTLTIDTGQGLGTTLTVRLEIEQSRKRGLENG